MLQLSRGAGHGRLHLPDYDRARLRTGVVHLGVGGFHRAHQAVYLDELARTGSTGWGEVGVGLRSPVMKRALQPQGCLFTVLERDGLGERARVIGSMRSYFFAPDGPGVVLEQLADADVHLVTLTVTGDGYELDGDGAFAPEIETLRHDLEHPDAPVTWFAFLVRALQRRRVAGLGGFTVLSCDNVAANGAAARSAVLGFAECVDPGLSHWIDRNVAFPHSMVDRITPRPTAELPEHLDSRYGFSDRAPVVTEPFTQWVIEDKFASAAPPLADVGAQVVPDVAPYKLAKTRLLNGAHTAMAYLGHLAGHETTADVVSDPVMREFLVRLMREEIAPLLRDLPGMSIDDYISTLVRRFANSAVGDPLVRLCGRGSTKVPAYLLPSLAEARRRRLPTPLLSLAVAGWFRYLRGYDTRGLPIEINDARLGELQPLALRGGCDPGPLLTCRSTVGPLADDLVARRQLRMALESLDDIGPMPTIRTWLQRSDDPMIPAQRGPSARRVTINRGVVDLPQPVSPGPELGA